MASSSVLSSLEALSLYEPDDTMASEDNLDIPTQLPSESRLLDLPAELLQMILSLVITTPDLSYYLSFRSRHGHAYIPTSSSAPISCVSSLSIAKTCKLLRQEALYIYRTTTQCLYTSTCKDKPLEFDDFIRHTSLRVKSRITSLHCDYVPPLDLASSLVHLPRLRTVHVFVSIDDRAQDYIPTKKQVRDGSIKAFEALLRFSDFKVKPFKELRNKGGKVEVTVGFEMPYCRAKNRRTKTVPCLYNLNQKKMRVYWNRDEYPISADFRARSRR